MVIRGNGLAVLTLTIFVLLFSVSGRAADSHRCADSLIQDSSRSAIQSTLLVAGDDLYRDCEGELLFQTRKTLVSESDDAQVVDLFIRNVVPTGAGRDNAEILIGDVVDSASWRHVFDYLYRDDDSLFCVRPMSSGAKLFLMTGVDPSHFTLLRSGGVAEGMSLSDFEAAVDGASSDVEKAKILDSISHYAVFKNEVFFRCSVLRGADLGTFNVTGRWEAADRNNRYLGDRANPVVD